MHVLKVLNIVVTRAWLKTVPFFFLRLSQKRSHSHGASCRLSTFLIIHVVEKCVIHWKHFYFNYACLGCMNNIFDILDSWKCAGMRGVKWYVSSLNATLGDAGMEPMKLLKARDQRRMPEIALTNIYDVSFFLVFWIPLLSLSSLNHQCIVWRFFFYFFSSSSCGSSVIFWSVLAIA